MRFEFFLCNRERLIHVLALRPYKKPELYERIKKGKIRFECSQFFGIVDNILIYMSTNSRGFERTRTTRHADASEASSLHA